MIMKIEIGVMHFKDGEGNSDGKFYMSAWLGYCAQKRGQRLAHILLGRYLLVRFKSVRL